MSREARFIARVDPRKFARKRRGARPYARSCAGQQTAVYRKRERLANNGIINREVIYMANRLQPNGAERLRELPLCLAETFRSRRYCQSRRVRETEKIVEREERSDDRCPLPPPSLSRACRPTRIRHSLMTRLQPYLPFSSFWINAASVSYSILQIYLIAHAYTRTHAHVHAYNRIGHASGEKKKFNPSKYMLLGFTEVMVFHLRMK